MTDVVSKGMGTLPCSALSPETQQLVEQVQTTKRPVVITMDGRYAAVLVEATEFERLLRRLELMRGILAGKRDIAAGRSYSQEEAETMMDDWLGEEK